MSEIILQDDQIEIQLSKKKMIASFFGALAFVALGLWFLIDPPVSDNPIFGNPTIIFVAGLASVLFFGLAAILLVRKLSDKKVGLIISKEGIVDNSSGVSAGLILWRDIKEIKVTQVMNQKFLMVIVENPREYLDKIKNFFKRKTMEINYKSYGSPISISANSLNCNFAELENIMRTQFYKNKSVQV